MNTVEQKNEPRVKSVSHITIDCQLNDGSSKTLDFLLGKNQVINISENYGATRTFFLEFTYEKMFIATWEKITNDSRNEQKEHIGYYGDNT